MPKAFPVSRFMITVVTDCVDLLPSVLIPIAPAQIGGEGFRIARCCGIDDDRSPGDRRDRVARLEGRAGRSLPLRLRQMRLVLRVMP